MISFQIWSNRQISRTKVHRQKNNFAFFLPVHYMGKYVYRQKIRTILNNMQNIPDKVDYHCYIRGRVTIARRNTQRKKLYQDFDFTAKRCFRTDCKIICDGGIAISAYMTNSRQRTQEHVGVIGQEVGYSFYRHNYWLNHVMVPVITAEASSRDYIKGAKQSTSY